MVGGERTVVVTFAILEKNKVLRQEAFRNLSMWAKTDKEYKIELPQDPLRYLQCVCTGKPEPSTRAWWENKLKLVFTCFDNPYWTSKEEKSVACGTAFTVQGDAPPLMRIERNLSSAASNQTYSNGTQSMSFSTISAGNMVIDLNNQTAKVGTTSIMQYYKPSSSFLIPRTGTQTISGTGTVKYRERWE
jgi:phage-related protein